MLSDRNWIRQLLPGEREQHEPLVLLVLVDHIDVRLLRHVEIEEQPVTWRYGAAVPKPHSPRIAERVERRFDVVARGSGWRGSPADSRGPQSHEKDGEGEGPSSGPGQLPPFEPRSGGLSLRLRRCRANRRGQRIAERAGGLISLACRRRQCPLDDVHERRWEIGARVSQWTDVVTPVRQFDGFKA